VKIVLSCGHPLSGYERIHEELVSAGLAQARPSRREALTADALLQRICDTHGLRIDGGTPIAQITPGKIWQDLADDLLVGNVGETDWGWAAADLVWLLEFWRDFDPNTRFVLVYGKPERIVGQTLLGRPLEPDEIPRTVAEWEAFNGELLRFYNRNPDRCLLVNAADTVRSPAQFVEKVAAAFGLQLEFRGGLPAGPSGVLAIASGLAKPFVDGYHEAKSLYQELESSADFTADDSDRAVAEPDGLQAWQEFSLLLSELERACRAADSEIGRMGQLQAQFDLLQQSAESAKRQIETLGTELVEGKAKEEALRAEIVRLQASGNVLADENGRLACLLGEHQEELERCRQKLEGREALEENLAEAMAHFAHFEGLLAGQQAQLEQLAAAHDAKSQQAAELQKVLDSKDAEAAGLMIRLDKAGQENQLLQLQLHQAQEELERCHELAQANSAAAQSLAVAKQQLASYETALGEQQVQIERLAEQRDGWARQAAESLDALEAATSENLELRSQNTGTAEENGFLKLQIAQLQDELIDSHLKLQASAEIEDSLAKAAGQIATYEETLRGQLEQVGRLADERDGWAKQAAESFGALEAAKSENLELRSQITGTAEENEFLKLQITQLQDELIDCHLKLQANAEIENSLAQAVGQIASQEDTLRGQLQQMNQLAEERDGWAKQAAESLRALEAATSENMELRSQNTGTAEENEFMKLQITQLQDELIDCHLKLQARTDIEDSLAKAAGQIATYEETLRGQLAQMGRLAEDRDGWARQAAELQAQLDQSLKTLGEREEAHAELKRLSLASEKEADGLKAEMQLMAKASEEKKARLAEALATLSMAQAEADRSGAEKSAMAQDLSLLQIQLNQVQEELAYYFQQYQELAGKFGSGGPGMATGSRQWYYSGPTEAVYDLRREIVGENWYYAEQDGRWAGPETSSTLRLPAMPGGHYEVRFDIAEAMAPEILLGMEVSLNGRPLRLSDDWLGYPALVSAQFAIGDTPEQPVWEFQFKFPELISPSEVGIDDQDKRKLAIRLRSLELKLID